MVRADATVVLRRSTEHRLSYSGLRHNRNVSAVLRLLTRASVVVGSGPRREGPRRAREFSYVGCMLALCELPISLDPRWLRVIYVVVVKGYVVLLLSQSGNE